jgi:uncharacterized damage-inducible protein DinB
VDGAVLAERRDALSRRFVSASAAGAPEVGSTSCANWQGGRMTDPDAKAHLQHYLQGGRDALVWKLEGLSEYDVRRPMTATGTNLLGLLKHLAYVEMGYFGVTFGRPVAEAQPWIDDVVELNADMWASAEESREDVVALYRRAWAAADATIEALPLDATGRVPWWKGAQVTLHRVLVHVIAETHRHAGHADIVRELVDGAVGLRAENDNLPADTDAAWWQTYREQLERVARAAGC